MTKKFINKYLIPFWISFPEDKYYPIGLGVTAFSIEDAYSLLKELGIEHQETAKRTVIQENIKWDEIPYKQKVHPNMGPIVVRGVWYPHYNSGYI